MFALYTRQLGAGYSIYKERGKDFSGQARSADNGEQQSGDEGGRAKSETEKTQKRRLGRG